MSDAWGLMESILREWQGEKAKLVVNIDLALKG